MQGHIMSLNPEYGTAKQFSFYKIGNSLTGLWRTIKLLVKLVRTWSQVYYVKAHIFLLL